MVHVVTIGGGDTNLTGEQRRAIAEAAEAILIEGHGVDAAFVIGAKVAETHVLAEGGSDHPPVVYVLHVGLTRIVVLQWNVYVGQAPRRVRRRLRQLIKRWQPDAILLSEAYRCRDQLATLKGYHLIQGDNVGEGADCALLLRVDHHLVRSGIAEMTKRWIGPKHKLDKSPRHYPRGRARIAPGVVLRAMSIHFPTTDRAGHNTDAVEESVGFFTGWLKRGHHA